MHGKKREEYKARLRDPKVAAALSQKAEQWHSLVQELASRRRKTQNEDNDDSAAATLALTEKALLVNPDPLYLWNHRRELLLPLLLPSSKKQPLVLLLADNNHNNGDGDDTESSQQVHHLQGELALTQASLTRNPKAYGAWFHRKWMLQQCRPATKILEGELALTAQLLQLDERNFHCWNYRRFVVAALQGSWDGSWATPPMGPQVSSSSSTTTTTNTTTTTSSTSMPTELLLQEWDFTRAKIKENFSNFSAFHYRSQLLPFRLALLLHGDDSSTMVVKDLIEEELALVEDAICTEPDDQTAWWYHAALLWMNENTTTTTTNSTTTNSDDDNSNLFKVDAGRLEEHADLLRELLAESGSDNNNNKWILLGLHRVLTVLNSSKDDTVEEQKSLLEQLMQVDSDRSQRYRELMEALQ
jgi:geranylgeranyl transferase type-2 subunit alpha